MKIDNKEQKILIINIIVMIILFAILSLLSFLKLISFNSLFCLLFTGIISIVCYLYTSYRINTTNYAYLKKEVSRLSTIKGIIYFLSLFACYFIYNGYLGVIFGLVGLLLLRISIYISGMFNKNV